MPQETPETPGQPEEEQPISVSPGADVPSLDFFLNMLLNVMGDAAESSATLTLYYGGAIISGYAIPDRRWVSLWLDQLASGGVPVGTEAQQEIENTFDAIRASRGDTLDLSHTHRFVNMRDVTVYLGGNQFNIPLWRGRLEQVDGWSMGTFGPRG